MTLPYSTQQLTPADEQAVLGAMRSGWLTSGPAVPRFEDALAEYVGAKHAVAVSSGTAALHLAFMAAGVRDKVVITSPLSFVATANAAVWAGAKTVEFVDIDPQTGQMPTMTARVSGEDVLVPVHYAGRPAIFGLWPDDAPVIEDACHALGAVQDDGHHVGSCTRSLACCFSFHPVKPITTGEGGAITTNDEGLAEALRALRNHGRDGTGRMVGLGLNYRMTDIQAALGLAQLARCEEWRLRRRELSAEYNRLMSSTPLRAPLVSGRAEHAHHLKPVGITDGHRDAVKAALNAQGIGAQIHYSPIIPLHPWWRRETGAESGDYPNAEAWAAETLSLPLHAGMTEKDVERVVEALGEALA